MSYEVECPYCEEYAEINFNKTSGGDGEEFGNQCNHCGEIFKVTTEYTPTYSSSKDCEVREENHVYVKSLARTSPENNYYVYVCKKCDACVNDNDLFPDMSIRKQVVQG